MATENIGTTGTNKYNTKVPSLTENADIQTALKIYHWGQETEPTTFPADSIAGHLKNLEDTKIDIVPIQVISGSTNDLNLKVTSGYYSISTNAIASAGLHYPASATAGMLHVVNDGSGLIYQTYIMTGGVNKFWWRGYYSGAWTDWAQASDTAHSHPEFVALAGDIATKQATITGAASSVTSANLALSAALVSDASGKIAASAVVSTTELEYLNGVTSAIQTQINTKAPLASPALTGTATAVNMTVTGTTTLAADTSIGAVSSTELGYLDGVTSAIQTQFTTAGTNLTNGLATKLTQSIGYKDTGTTAIGGNATKKVIIASPTTTGGSTPNITGYTPSEGDLWFW